MPQLIRESQQESRSRRVGITLDDILGKIGYLALLIPLVYLTVSCTYEAVTGRDSMLLSGSFRTVELQPLSVQQQTGINVAAGVAPGTRKPKFDEIAPPLFQPVGSC
jgi:hypothetical protein